VFRGGNRPVEGVLVWLFEKYKRIELDGKEDIEGSQSRNAILLLLYRLSSCPSEE